MQDVTAWATLNIVAVLGAYLATAAAMVAVIAVAAFAFQLMTGRARRVTSDTAVLAVKIGAALFYAANFGTVFPLIMSIANELVGYASQFVSNQLALACPFSITLWNRMDCALNQLIGGLLPPMTLASGFLGFLVACIFSGPVGFSIFLIGLGILYMAIMAALKAVFTFLNAYIGIALLAIISPLMIPMVMLRVTKPYFDKWLRLIFGMMLQPVFLFAYLSIMLATFDVVVFSGPKSLYVTVAGAQATVPGFQFGQYMLATGAYEEGSAMDASVNLNPKELAGQLGLPNVDTGIGGAWKKAAVGLNAQYNSLVGNNAAVQVPVRRVNFTKMAIARGTCQANADNNSVCNTTFIVQLLMSCIMSFVVLYIIYVLQDYVPYMGSFISGEIMSIPNLGDMAGKSLDSVAGAVTGK
ncbi:MAG: type IV secretion system protein [Alphaproteobacteria bacterium]|nr:type IV secretion system protein [Alphaproteobacteria bacterium]